MKNLFFGFVIGVGFILLLGYWSVSDTENVDLQIDVCYMNAYSNYRQKWENYCRVNNIPTDADGGCEIPVAQANVFEDQLQGDQELCVARYQ